MDNKSNKVDIFLAEIEKETEEQKLKTKRQAQLFAASELEKVENDVLEESYKRIQASAADIRKENGKRICEAVSSLEKEFLLHREEIIDEVMLKTASLLNGYTQTEKYKDFLIKSAKEIKEVYKNTEFILFMKKEDAPFCDMLKNESGAAKTEFDDEIQIGGLKAINLKGTLSVNDTLDLRLENSRDVLRQSEIGKVTAK